MPQEEVAMNIEMKGAHYWLFIMSLGAQACSTGPTSAMAAEQSGNSSTRQTGGHARPNYIKVEAVREFHATPSVRLTGKVCYDENHTQRVAAPIDGRVNRILVTLGDRVLPGQALIELTAPGVSTLQADAQKARQDLNVSTQAFERARILKADNAISDREMALAEADYKKNKSDVARAVAQLRSLQVSPGNPTTTVAIRAQIAGTIVERDVLIGQEVRDEAVAPLLTISALETVWVQADVREQDISLVHKGVAVHVSVPAYPTESFTGMVDHVGDVLNADSRSIKLRCSVHNSGQRLKPEMFATIDLAESAADKAIFIPTSAILTDSEHTRVFVADNDRVYQQRVVTLGSTVDNNVRVLGGVQVGEQIVTQGALFLQQGSQRD